MPEALNAFFPFFHQINKRVNEGFSFSGISTFPSCNCITLSVYLIEISIVLSKVEHINQKKKKKQTKEPYKVEQMLQSKLTS